MENQTNIELSCDIVGDLLPVYCDKQATNDSVRAVEAHLQGCGRCRRIYEEMSGDMERGFEQENQDRAIEPLKKVKRRQTIRVIIFFLLGAGVCAGIFCTLFFGIVPVKSEDVVISPKAEIMEDAYNLFAEDRKEEAPVKRMQGFKVSFELKLSQGKYIEFRQVEDSDADTVIYKIYSVMNLPFDDRGKTPNEANVGVESNEKFTDKDKVIFRFRDQDVVYSLKQIAQEQGIQ
ncbi:MAG: zf-HC2 domain-containing protein [Clostridium sp.]|nr:zf-HC2 domain-containing protein [Clostridium sp.]